VALTLGLRSVAREVPIVPLKISMVSANEDLVGLVNRGYAVLDAIKLDYPQRERREPTTGKPTFDDIRTR
jgi:hypothetical protein